MSDTIMTNENPELKYTPLYANVDEIYEDVVDSLKEIAECEGRAVTKFAKYLDEYVHAVVTERLEEFRFLITIREDDLFLNVYTEQLSKAEIRAEGNRKEYGIEYRDEKYEGRYVPLWSILDEIPDHTEDDVSSYIILRKHAQRFRELADKIDKACDEAEEEFK